MKALSSRRRGINVDMTDSQMKASKDRRAFALKGLRKYLSQTNERLNEGANVWAEQSLWSCRQRPDDNHSTSIAFITLS